jgi:hypothetical protein
MTVLRLPGGDLVLHSPIAISDDLRAEIDALGTVRFIVAPNRMHHLFVADAARLYPDASLLAAPGLPEKRRDLTFERTIEDDPPAEWKGEIETHYVRGHSLLNEVALWHRASGTLILTDLCFNVQESSTLLRIVLRMNGIWRRFAPSRLIRLFTRDRAALEQSVRRVLEWDFDRVVVAHGEVLEEGGKRALGEAWLR